MLPGGERLAPAAKCSGCDEVKPIRATGLCGACFWDSLGPKRLRALAEAMRKDHIPKAQRFRSSSTMRFGAGR